MIYPEEDKVREHNSGAKIIYPEEDKEREHNSGAKIICPEENKEREHLGDKKKTGGRNNGTSPNPAAKLICQRAKMKITLG